MDNEQFVIVSGVISRFAGQYVFGPHEYEDVWQQAFVFSMECLDDWDGARPLENFLSIALPNKLKNFKRKNYCRLNPSEKFVDINEMRKRLVDLSFDEGEGGIRGNVRR